MDEKKLTRFDTKNYRATIIGAFVGIVGITLTLLFFFYKEKPYLEIQTLSSTNVLDINASLSSLDILLDSTSLKQTNENIKVYSIRVINSGNANITTELFDSNAPFGIRIRHGYFLDPPEIISASNEYLFSRILNSTKEEIHFTPFILDCKDYIDLKFLIVHHNDTIPLLEAFGKMSGQKEIIISDNLESIETPFIYKTFGGNIYVQLTRAVGYFILFFLALLLLVHLSEYFGEKRKTRGRENIAKAFKETKPLSQDYSFILNIYKKYGTRKIFSYHTLLSRGLSNAQKQYDSLSGIKPDIITELIDLEVIYNNNGKLSFNKNRQDKIIAFSKYLLSTKAKKYDPPIYMEDLISI